MVQSNFGGVLEVAGVPVGVELGNFLSVGGGALQRSRSTNRRRGEETRSVKQPIRRVRAVVSVKHRTCIPLQGFRSARLECNLPPVHRTHPDGYDFDVDGSIMIIVATDAPLTSRNLERLARRAFLWVIAKTGGFASNGSGDYVIAFSTHPAVRIRPGAGSDVQVNRELPNAAVSPLFLAAVEATEEAILNSLFMAETMVRC